MMQDELMFEKSSVVSFLEGEDARFHVAHILGRMRFSLSRDAWNFFQSFSKPRLLSTLNPIERKWADRFVEGLLIRPVNNDEIKRIRSIYLTSLYSNKNFFKGIHKLQSFQKELPIDFLFKKNMKLKMNPGLFSMSLGNKTHLVSTPFGSPVHLADDLFRILHRFKIPKPIKSVSGIKRELIQSIYFLFHKELLVEDKFSNPVSSSFKEDIFVHYPTENRWRQRYLPYAIQTFKSVFSHHFRIALIGPCNIQLVAEALEHLSYMHGISTDIHSVLQPEELNELSSFDFCICSGLPYAADLYKSYLNKDQSGLIQAQSRFIARTDDLVHEIRKHSSAKIIVLSLSPPGLNGHEAASPFYFEFRQKLTEANQRLSFLFSQMDDVFMIDYASIESGHQGYFWDDIFNGSLHHSAISSWQWVSLKPSFAHSSFDTKEKNKTIPPTDTFQQDPAESIAIVLIQKILSIHEKKIRLLVIEGDDLLWKGRVWDNRTVFDSPLNFYADVEKYFYAGIHEAIYRILQSGVKLICLSADVPRLKKNWKEKDLDGFFIRPSRVDAFIGHVNEFRDVLKHLNADENESCWLSLYQSPPKGYKGLFFDGNPWDLKKALLNHPSIPNSLGKETIQEHLTEATNKSQSYVIADAKIKNTFQNLLCKHLGCTRSALNGTDDLRSVGLDSLQSLHLLVEIEKAFDISLPETTFTEPVVFNKKILFLHLLNAIQKKQLDSKITGSVEMENPVSLISIIFSQLKNSQHPWLIHFNSEDKQVFFSAKHLLKSVNRMVDYLKKKPNVKPGKTILFMLLKEENFVVSFLACLHLRLVPILIGIPDKKRILIWSKKIAKQHSIHFGLSDLNIDDNVFPEFIDFKQKIFNPQKRQFGDMIFYLTSSGTTGVNKLLGHTDRTILYSLQQIRNGLKVDTHDTIVSWMPLHHTIGLINHLLMPLSTGLRCVIFSPMIFSQQPHRFMWSLAQYDNTIAFMPCFALSHLTRQVPLRILSGKTLHRVKAIVCAGEFIDSDVMDSFYMHFGAIGFRQSALLTGYGMAETAGVVTQSKPYYTAPFLKIHKNKFLHHGIVEPSDQMSGRSLTMVSSGILVDRESIRIDSAHSGDSKIRVGAIHVRLPSLSPTVYSKLQSDGFYPTGDNGFLYEENLYVVSREKEVLILSGRTIPPQIIEQCYARIIGNAQSLAFEVYIKKKGTHELCIYLEGSSGKSKQRQDLEMSIRKRVYNETKINVSKFYHSNEKLLKHTKSGKLIRNASVQIIKKKFLLS